MALHLRDFYLTVTGGFEHFQCSDFETGFRKNKKLFCKLNFSNFLNIHIHTFRICLSLFLMVYFPYEYPKFTGQPVRKVVNMILMP